MSDEHLDDDVQGGVIVPHAQLSQGALRGLVESFVLREGTEYGLDDVPLATKVAEVMRQLERGDARVVFDPRSESVDVVVSPQIASYLR